MTGILEHIDGRKLIVRPLEIESIPATLYLRKGIESAQYFPLLQSAVDVTVVDEKGYLMVQEIKPSLPKTQVEETKGPVDMLSSANVPRLEFGSGFTTVGSNDKATVKVDTRSQKDIDILTQWSYGQATSPTWTNCNDSMALSTEQQKERIRKLAKWYRDEVLQRNG